MTFEEFEYEDWLEVMERIEQGGNLNSKTVCCSTCLEFKDLKPCINFAGLFLCDDCEHVPGWEVDTKYCNRWHQR